MKKTLASAALVTCGAIGTGVTAHAQTSVTVYGIVDTAVEYYTNANAAGDNVVRMPSLGGGMFPSRLGFRGSEDLGGGLKAIFTLENGFTPDAGTLGQGGRLWAPGIRGASRRLGSAHARPQLQHAVSFDP